MKELRLPIAFFLMLSIVLVSVVCAEPSKDFLAPLKKDQKILLTSLKNGHYEITILKDSEEGLIHKVIEIGKDYIVVDDTIRETRIPVYRIKSITILKLPKGD